MPYDPLYYLITLPGVFLALWAHRRISSAWSAGSRIPASAGLSGAEAAARLMESRGLAGVRIEPSSGLLNDYFDPTEKLLRLPEEVYAGRSIAALGAAAHEVGHAIQANAGSRSLRVHNAIVLLSSLGVSVWTILFLAGIVLGVGPFIVQGINLFSLILAVQLLNLPVEFDANRRAREALLGAGLVGPEEEPAVAKVLDAAAWTSVADVLTGTRRLISGLVPSRWRGGRRED